MERFRMKYILPAIMIFSLGLMACNPKNSPTDIATRTPITTSVPVLPVSNGDPCEEAYEALKNGLSRRKPDNITIDKNRIEVWGADPSGIATHPSVLWRGKDHSWKEVVSFMRSNCGDDFNVSFYGTGAEEYEYGVIVTRKPVQEFSFPEVDLSGVKNTIMTTIAALLGIGALGWLGAKKAFA